MKESAVRWQVAGFLFTAVVGTGLHFLFELTGGNLFADWFNVTIFFLAAGIAYYTEKRLLNGTVLFPSGVRQDWALF